MKLNKKEVLLINPLRRNSRISLSKIARRANVATSTLCSALHKLLKERIITPVTILNFENLGYKRYILLIESKSNLPLLRLLKKEECINNMVRSLFGVMIEIVIKEEKELIFLEKKIKKFTDSYYIHPIKEVLKQEELVRI